MALGTLGVLGFLWLDTAISKLSLFSYGVVGLVILAFGLVGKALGLFFANAQAQRELNRLAAAAGCHDEVLH